MGQTVNLLALPSVVRIHPHPQKIAEVTQLIERQPSKLKVAGLSPVFRSKGRETYVSLFFYVKTGRDEKK